MIYQVIVSTCHEVDAVYGMNVIKRKYIMTYLYVIFNSNYYQYGWSIDPYVCTRYNSSGIYLEIQQYIHSYEEVQETIVLPTYNPKNTH